MKIRLKNMSKFKIILFVVIGVGLTVLFIIWQYMFSFHSVNFIVGKDVTVEVYKVINNKEQPTFQTVSANINLSLQNGDYCTIPIDSKYDTDPICFKVQDKDISVTIDPNYSKDYLENLLLPQLVQINSIVSSKYSSIINDYTFKTGQLYGKGEWYGGTLTKKVAPSDRGDVYRFILKKTDNKWGVVAYPQISLNKFDYPNIPVDILNSVNKLLGVY